MDQQIRRRAIFFIGGYDPKTPEAYFGRMAKEIARFEKLWSFESSISEISGDDAVGTVTIDTTDAVQSWRVSADFNFLVLDSLVLKDFARPLPVRLGKYLLAFADFVVSGAAFRIFAKAWRFGLYFLFPFLMVLLFALLGWIAARLSAPYLGPVSWLLGLAAFALAQWRLGERWPVNHLMDLWSFSRNFIRQNRSDAEALMERFAATITGKVKDGRFDEVILVGHSTGGLLILDVAAKCLRRDREFSQRAGHVAILTLGSTALKAGLHPGGKKFRADVKQLLDDGKLEWVEIQCLTDVINFYKSNPVADIGLPARPDFPLARRVRMKDMLEAATYKRIKRNFFRIHYQYVFGNTKAYWYDFFQICCGPISLIERAKNTVSGSMKTTEPSR